MNKLLTTALTLGVFFGGHAVSAATINPDANETATPGGDYSDVEGTGPNITSSQPLLLGITTLNAGLRVNCLSGDCSDSSGLRDPSDALFLDVAADREITSLVLNVEGTPTDISNISFVLRVDSDLMSPGSEVEFSSTGNVSSQELLSTGQTFGPGTYSIFFGATGSSADTAGQLAWSLTGTVTDTSAAAVPLPASAPILLAALGAFGLMRRKKR
ncbi:MAG: VPLPA-CTERM sorting domain-containing protein [Aliishimia sp.]